MDTISEKQKYVKNVRRMKIWNISIRVALFGTEVVAGSALFGTSKNLVAEPSLFGTVRKNILVA